MRNFTALKVIPAVAPETIPDTYGAPVLHWGDPSRILTHRNVPGLGFGFAVTQDNTEIQLWADPLKLLQHLVRPDAGVILSYNGLQYDYAVLLGTLAPCSINGVGALEIPALFQNAYNALEARSYDFCAVLQVAIGHRISLDALTTAMFRRPCLFEKTKAYELFMGDPNARCQAVNYAIDRVVQLRNVFGAVYELGQIAFFDRFGKPEVRGLNITTSFDAALDRVTALVAASAVGGTSTPQK